MNAIRYIQSIYNIIFKPRRVIGLPVHINIEPSTFCNYHCAMCSRNLIDRPQNMSFDFFKNIIEQINPHKLSLNGYGEPFMNRDIFRMIEFANSKKISVVTTTNGSMLLKDAAEIAKIDISVLRVSLDSPDSETYKKIRNSESFQNVVDGIFALQEMYRNNNKQHSLIRLEFLILENNYLKIPEFVRFAAKLGVKHLYFQILSEINSERKMRLVGNINIDELYNIVKAAYSDCRKLGINNNLDYILENINYIRIYYKNDKLPIPAKKCFNPWITVYITVDGDVWPCCKFGSRNITVGNLKELSFAEIWNSDQFAQFRDNLKHKKNLNNICRICDMQSFFDLLIVWAKLLNKF